jgi:hypothetical protein
MSHHRWFLTGELGCQRRTDLLTTQNGNKIAQYGQSHCWPRFLASLGYENLIFLSVVTTVLVVAGRKPKATVPKDFKFKNHFNRSAPTEETFVLKNPGKRGPGRPKRQEQRDENQDRDVEAGLGEKHILWCTSCFAIFTPNHWMCGSFVAQVVKQKDKVYLMVYLHMVMIRMLQVRILHN